MLRVTNPNRRLVDVENVLTHNIGTGAIPRQRFPGGTRGRSPNSGLHFIGLTCGSAFVGRARQRSDLEAALIRCRAGHGGLVLVVGEAGPARSDWSARC